LKTETMRVINNELYIGDYKISQLAEAYKTPLYVYDEVHIRNKLAIFKNFFKSKHYECQTIYASKAFLCTYMAKLIESFNMGIDAISIGDLYLLKKSNFSFQNVILHGNNKSKEELEYALNEDVGYIVVDNIDELELLSELTKKSNKDVRILFRVNPGIEAHTHAYIMTSLLSSKFGESIYDMEKMSKIFAILEENKHLKMQGFHAHIGSNINNSQSFIAEVETMMKFIIEVETRFSFTTKVLNLGGGFGIKYLDTDQEINLEEMLKGIVQTIDAFVEKEQVHLDKVLIEPGRSIVGDAGFTIYSVGSIKKTYGGKNYIFVDGGMTDNIRPALYQAQYTVDVANRMHQDKVIPYDVVGKCCESGDIVVKDYLLSDVRKGDYIVTYATGAYGYAMASNYNGFAKNTVIFVRDKEINMVVKRETNEDLVRNNVTNNVEFFDTHSDMLYDLYTKKIAGVINRFNDYHVPQLLNSNVKASIWTMYSPEEFDLIEACKIAMKEIDIKKLPGFKVIFGLEGLRNLKKVEDIEVLYNMGFRHAMLTWNEENNYATGAKSDPTHGLKEEGKRLLKKMEELDMIVDLAHLNEKSFFEVLKVTQKNIIYSHGNVRALCNHVRNVTDEQMKALKAVDGLLGLTLANNFVASDEKEQTLDRFLDHVDYAVKFMSVDNICFGFDFMDYLSDFPNSNLEAVNNATLVYRIAEGLEKRGYNAEDIKKMCYDNFYHRFQDKIMLRG